MLLHKYVTLYVTIMILNMYANYVCIFLGVSDFFQEMMLEVSLLREELEMTKISEMENSEAECAILRSLRSEVMLQRQEDLAESRHALQSEEEICQDLRKELHLATSSTSSRSNFQNIPTPKSTVRNSRFSQRHAPKQSTLRSILASHPEPEVAEASVDLLAELQAAESRSHTLADEMHVQEGRKGGDDGMMNRCIN